MRFPSFVLAALLASVAVRAEEPAQGSVPPRDAQNAHLAAAVRLYQKLDLEAALAELSQAEAAAKDSEDDTVRVLIYRGLIYSETSRPADANDQFKRALAIRPWAEVPEGTSPRIAKTFADARRSLWGMASVRPPQKRTAPASPVQAVPAKATQAAPAAQPAVEKK